MKNLVAELRAKRGWSQTGFAEMLGVSRQSIHAIETEKYEASLSLAFKIARLFDARIEDVFLPNGKATERKVIEENAAEEAGINLPTHLL